MTKRPKLKNRMAHITESDGYFLEKQSGLLHKKDVNENGNQVIIKNESKFIVKTKDNVLECEMLPTPGPLAWYTSEHATPVIEDETEMKMIKDVLNLVNVYKEKLIQVAIESESTFMVETKDQIYKFDITICQSVASWTDGQDVDMNMEYTANKTHQIKGEIDILSDQDDNVNTFERKGSHHNEIITACSTEDDDVQNNNISIPLIEDNKISPTDWHVETKEKGGYKLEKKTHAFNEIGSPQDEIISSPGNDIPDNEIRSEKDDDEKVGVDQAGNVEMNEGRSCKLKKKKHNTFIKAESLWDELSKAGNDTENNEPCRAKAKDNGRSCTDQNRYVKAKLKSCILERKKHCNVCKQSFPRRDELLAHMTKFHAQVCQKKFCWRQNMITHKQWHMNIGKYECKKCQERFKCRSGYTNHIYMVHDGGRNLCRCNICGVLYKKKMDLESHMKKVHGMSYASLSNLVVNLC